MSRRWLIVWLIGLVFIINACAGKQVVTEPSPPEEKKDPIQVFAPTFVGGSPSVTVELRIVIDPNPENSYIKWEWDSPDGVSGLSEHSINGVSAAKVFRPRLILVPGQYQIKATLYRGDESFSAETTVTVVGANSQF